MGELRMYESKFIKTGAFTTHYFEAGSGDPVLLIHGGGAGADSWGNWAVCFPMFAERMRVIAMDMVGFGRSDAPDPSLFSYTQDARNDQAIAFIEALGCESIHIVGNSMGGATALGVAMKRPDLVRSIVLMGSGGLNHELSAALAPVVNYDDTFEGMRKIVAVLANPDLEMPEELLRYRYELSIDPARKAAYKATMGWVKQRGGLHYEEREVAAVKTRCLVFAGKDDLVIPMKENVRFLELLENSTGYFLPHCRHWAMMEYPEIFTNVVIYFLQPAARPM
ncbi:alpha/beta hydrolase fold protein [Methylocella silvestris BL2]|uniref:Alpha/beta hydrolase fold protein n=2 Tax=Methylocella silvestris TaxID=199596 RepID=B8EST9_METSB|nr:alpha/beta hydrolase fold protein [Methylocella silvestris BL2]